MTMTAVKRLDCRGMQCPEPILQTAKAARDLESGGVLEILADDDAFPLDLKSWARSAEATISQLDEGAGGYRALVKISPQRRRVSRVRMASAAEVAAPPTPPKARRPTPAPAQAPSTRSPSARRHVAPPAEVPTLDCRGMQCPQPIVEIAKHARKLGPGGAFRVVADDDAFPLDLKSWCRSSGAELVSLNTDVGGVHTALVKRGARTTGTRRPTNPKPQRAQTPAAPQPVAAPTPAVPAVVAAAPVPTATEGATASLQLDLRGMTEADALARLNAAATLGDVAVAVVGDEALSPALMSWCGQTQARVTSLTTTDQLLQAQLRVVGEPSSAMVPAAAAQPAENRCALLILRSDHEALLAAMLVANGAAAQGMDVVIFFSFWGLNLLRGDQPRPNVVKKPTSIPQKMFKMLMPAGPGRQKLSKFNFGGMGKGMLTKIMKDQNIMTLPELMDSAAAQGVEYIACTMSMGVMGIQKRDLVDLPNLRFGGVAAFVDEASRAKINMVF